MLICHLGFGLCAALLAWLALTGIRTPVPIFGVLVLLGVARAFNAPAAQALMPSLLPEGDFPNAVAWNSSTFQVATVVGPALGGGLYALLGKPEAVYLLAAGLAVLDVLVLAGVKTRTGRMESKATSWSTVLAGVRYVWAEQGHPRHHLARPLRGAARRRGRADARLRAGRAAHRRVGAGHPPERARHRRRCGRALPRRAIR